MRRALFLLVPLSLTGCGQPAANNAVTANETRNTAAPANAPANSAAASRDQVLHSETVTGRFTGWEMGDYLWAHIAVPGHAPISAQPGPTPIDLFLDANRGREVTVDVATVRADVPENGGPAEIRRITGARIGAVTAQSWWQGLSAADRAAAQRRFEEGALSGG